MQLDRLAVRNFRRFENLEVTFDKSMTVLVGNNGSGKTAVLDAAAIALGAYLSCIPSASKRTIEKTDARIASRRVGSTMETRPNFPCCVSAEGRIFNEDIEWSRERNSLKGNATTIHARAMTDISRNVRQYLETGQRNPAWDDFEVDNNVVLPLVCYYGTGRLWNQAKHRGMYSHNSLRENAYINALTAKADNRLLERWLKWATLMELQKHEVPELHAVQKAVADCLCRATGKSAEAYYDIQNDCLQIDVWNEGNAESLPLNQLSDGYRVMLYMVCDIAYRMAELNPQLGINAVRNTPGVVLIDEVDLHLHPRWQSRILGDLQAIFPSVQFIVTTHSPSVIASVDRTKLRIFGDEGNVTLPGTQTFGKDVSAIYEDVLGASSRPEISAELFDQAYRALDRDQYDEARKLISQLEQMIGTEDSELDALRTSLWLAEER